MGFVKFSLNALAVSTLMAGVLASPVLAQTKTKDKPNEDSATSATAIMGQAREYCDRVAGNDESVRDALQEAGWDPEIDPFGAVPFYHEIEGTKDFPGVGRAEIWGFIEVYPSHNIGYCTFEIVDPEIEIPVAELLEVEGLSGDVEVNDEGAFLSLSNDDPPYHKLIHARQTTDSFFYQVTDIIERND